MQTPTIGRIVHFVLPESHRRAGQEVPAIITRTWDGATGHTVQLTPFVDVANDAPVSPLDCSSVPYSETRTPRSWHWPEREPVTVSAPAGAPAPL